MSLITSFEAAKPNKKVFDFRSDTVTKPTQQMLEAMISVEVGDDVKDDDPTVHKLQKRIAELCGKESALFVCSGVMGNQLAIRTHVTDCYSREVVLQEVIADYRSHVYKYELGGIAFNSGAQVQALHPPDNKMLTAEFIEKHIHSADNLHYPLTTIISLENTLNGTLFPLEEIKKIRALADKYKLKLHCDGARLWHASVATGLSLKELCEPFDSISMCCSKGLGTPVGSVLVGNSQFIKRARQYRKVFGGGWRQAGYLASACLYALDNHWARLKDDHLNCKLLHQEITKLGFISEVPDTNMIFVDASPFNTNWQTIIEKINQLQTNAEVKVMLEGEGPVGRFVVHMQTPKEAIDRLVELLTQVVSSLNFQNK